MKKLINIILALLLLSTPAFAADVKLSELPTASSMATGDIIPFTSDPGGTPVSKNITRENFALDMHSLLPLLPIATAAGTVDAITADYTPNVSLTDQKMVAFVATGANTSTTPTFSPDGLTARTIVKFGGGALVAGDIPAALAVCIVQYNLANTRWELLNPAHGKYLTGGTNTFNLTNGTASLDVAAGAVVDIDGNLKVGSTGSVLIGDTINSFVTLGMTVNQGAADDEILSLKSSDVAHTLTTVTEADTYGLMKKTAATTGGLTIRGLTDADAEGALTLEGIIGATDPTDTNAALVLIGSKQTGTTTAALAAAEEVLQIKNRTTDLVTVLGDGKVGINTTAPAAKLTLVDTSQSATNNPGNAAIKIYGTAVDATNPEFLNVGYDPTLDAGYLQSIKTGVGGDFKNLLFCPNGGNVGIGGTTATSPLYVTGNAYFTADVSALTFTDRTPFYSGDALAEIAKVKGKDGKIDHASLPVFAQAPKKKDIMKDRIVTKQRPKKDDNGQPILDAEGKPVMEDYEVTEKVKIGEENTIERDLGAMISVLTVAVQQLTERLEKLEKKK